MAYYSSFDQKLSDDTSLKIEKEKILNNLQDTVLPDVNHFFDLVQRNIKDKRESTKNKFKIKCKEFHNLTSLLLNLNIQPHLIEAGTMYIIFVLYESLLVDLNESITKQDISRLEQVFDRNNLNQKLINQALDYCKSMFEVVDEEDLHYFFQDNLIRKSKMGAIEKSNNYSLASNNETSDKILSHINFNIQTIQSTATSIGNGDYDDDSKSGKNVEWLETELKRVLNEEKELCFNLDDLVNIVFDRFQDEKYADDVFQNDLLNLLGLNQIELIGEIIQNKTSIMRSFRRRFNQFDDPQVPTASSSINNTSKPKQPRPPKPVYFKEQKPPSFTQTITIQTEQELKEQKLLNKLERKAYQERKRQKGNNEDVVNDYATNYQLPTDETSEFNFYLKRLENERTQREDMPYVFDMHLDIKNSTSFMANQKLLMPEGTEINDQKSYKEITVPPPEKPKKEMLEKYPLIEISSLDKLSQKIFAGFKTLNQVQSVVFETAIKTNENILASGPTGVGKTNIALLTMINEIKKNTCPDTGRINKENFKIIYVTPMKALASEMTDNFSKRLTKSVGLVVRESVTSQ